MADQNTFQKFTRTAGIAVLVGSAAVFVSHRITDLLFHGTLDRKEPAFMRKLMPMIAGAKADPEEERRKVAEAEEFAAKPHTVVRITSYDGTPLVGHFFPAEHPKRILIAMHGWRSAWNRDFRAIAGFWKDEGCSVLYAEQRGQGASGGEYMGFGLTERFDCVEWAKWASQNNPDRLPIYLAGISMGATTVLMAAGADLPDDVHGIIADCGFVSADTIWRHVTENNLHLSYRLRKKRIDRLCREKLGFAADEYTTLDAMANAKVPILFIHGTGDTFVPVSMTEQNYDACRAPKRKFLVQGANHGMSFLVDNPGYLDATRSFWKEFD